MMGITTLRSLLLAAFVLSNVSWTTSRHHFRHSVNGHRSRHRRQDAGLFHPASYVIPGGEGSGAWGEWGRVSPCSRTCGGGVAKQKRICLEVGPDGQSLCTGGDTKYFSCQTQDCPENAGDFRAEQCSQYDDQVFRGSGITYNWVPYTKAPNPCELNCMPRGERFYYRQKPQVVDGTRCNDESFDVCVDGICQPVGCDMMLGSNAREDKCRNCRGNGTNCYTVAGLLDTDDLRKGYNDILLIPQGATNVFIEEVRESNNYLALRAKQNNVYYLNGDYHIDFPRSLTIAGTLWHYERSQQGLAAPDKLRCLGPTIEPLYLSLLLQDRNVGINYEYSVPSALAPPPNQQYNWVHEAFSECSASCGGGLQVREVTCRSREELNIVDDMLCDEGLKPPNNQTCNIEACPPRWVEGPWSPCSRPCGDGGTRSRQVYCEKVITNRFPSIVADQECLEQLGPKPEKLYENCNQNASCPTWFTGPWKPCNRLCGEGKQTRQVVCYQKINGFVQLFEDNECEDEKPISEKACLLHPCDGVDWVLSDWSGCDTCLSMVRTRIAHCATKDHKVIDSGLCSYHPNPVLEEPCDRTKLPSCQVQWYATQWSNCSVECGKGVRTRRVFCGLFDGASVIKVGDERCDALAKYNDTIECVIPKEKCPAKWFAGPWSECTKECGGGEQYRRVMCLSGGKEVLQCDKETILDSTQSCNIGPCDKDDLLPLDSKTTPILDDYDEEYCIEEDEEYPEAGAEADLSPVPTLFPDFVFVDDVTTERDISTESGSGIEWTEFSTETDETSTTDITINTDSTVSYSTDAESSTISVETETISTEASETESTNSISTESFKSSKIDSSSSIITESTDSTTDNNEFSSTESESTTDKEFSTSEAIDYSTIISSESSITDSDESSTTERDPSSTTVNSLSSTTQDSESSKTETTESGLSSTTENALSITTNDGESTVTEIESSTTGNTGSSTLESTLSSILENSKFSTTEIIASSTTDNAVSSTTENHLSSTSESAISSTTESAASSTSESDISSTTESAASSTSESDISSTTESAASSTSESAISSTTESAASSISESDISSTTESAASSTSESDISSTTESAASSKSESDISSTTESAASSTSESDISSTTESAASSTSDSDISSTTEIAASSTSESDMSSTTESAASSTSESDISSTTESVVSSTSENDISSTTESVSSSTSEIEISSTTESVVSTTSEIEIFSTTESVASSTSESDISSTTESAAFSTSESDISSTTESAASSTSESDISSTTEITASSTSETNISSTTESAASSTSESDISSIAEGEMSSTSDVSITTESLTTGGSTESTISESTTDYSTQETGTTGSAETTETGASSTSSDSTDASTSEQPATSESSPWDWSSTIEIFTNKPRCKPRRRAAKCTKSKFGCCPDKITPAAGPFDEGCPNPETCKDLIFGCCPDGVSPAAGPQGRGCPVFLCNETLYGCCSDNTTSAEGNNEEGCPPLPPACKSSKHGCCGDNETEAKGPEKEGCPEKEEDKKIDRPPVIDKGCATSDFGCCFDNETDASGPNGEGCPCSISAFGCCPDGVTTAGGNDLEGCLMSCNTSAYGCCPDGETPAHGPQFEGCCLQHVFGCCPDNYRPAEGPQLEGCGCQYARFGCCSDNITVARGPNMEGCGCEHSRYGCCPDRHTEAQGPEFKGCQCHTYQFGCCLDGVTIASGPELEGCRCERSKYGCCGDEISFAKGPNMEGCDCSNSKYGCCPDGRTEAKGEKFLNCSDVPINRQAACGLDNDKGTCRNYTVLWFYDMQYGGCSQFWYGGCEGNGNRFITKEECEDVCVQPSPKDACNLPKVKATCEGYHVRWYYDSAREQCSQFVYGGCLGNANNFDTKELCQERCEPEKTEDQCNLSMERGPCAGNFARWGYSAERRRCEQFVWGGCGGNQNRYDSEAACQLRCDPPGKPRQACSLPQDTGNCTEKNPTWSFSQTENRCVPFYYTGCGGNDNRFDSEHSCDESCPSAYVQEVCTLPAMVGDCADYTQKWFFDTTKKRCRLFYYGGCGGNGNNFFSESECENRCSEQPTTTTVHPEPPQNQTEPTVYRERSEFCLLDIDKGPCTQSIQRWGYEAASDACVQFEYGGCGGNRNNFPNLEYCQLYCGPTTPPQDVCQLPFMSGPCDQSIMQWFYDSASDSCSLFTYGGCEGNGNRFNSLAECEGRCRAQTIPPATTTTPSTTTIAEETVPSECQVPLELEECVENGEVWFLDLQQRVCVPLRNEGPGLRCRHSGVFGSQEACERACGAFRGLDVCRYSLDPGPCHESIPKMYFEIATGRCEPFSYGGCHGGPNRFSTIEECEQICRPNADPCGQSPEPGNCLAYFRMWYYDSDRNICDQFVYGGCNGNDNRFETQAECEGRCKKDVTTTFIPTRAPVPTTTAITMAPSPTPEFMIESECATPVSLAPCGENVTVYYFDTRTQACLVGDFGGCRYSNSYRTEEECQRRCGAFRGLDVCGSRLDPGPCLNTIPKFYWDPISGRCLSFAYGGCHGGPNRFSTENECEEICRATGPETETGNEVLPDCDAYNAECAALQCEYGVQRTRSRSGCERCTCVAPEVNCAQIERDCLHLKCNYGIQKAMDANGCERCNCIDHPCANKECSGEERCVATPYRDPITQEVLYSSDCRLANKSGSCPSYLASASSTESRCRRQCNDDADCPGVGKCCERGCSQLCLEPVATTSLETHTTAYVPELPEMPHANSGTETEVHATLGGTATLRCRFVGNPPPKITWQRGQITIEGDVGRYRLLSDGALEIVSLYRNDSGVYICIAENELGIARQEINLQVDDGVEGPAGIAGLAEAVVVGELGHSLSVRCMAYGYPPPSIYWYHGRNGPMVPFSSVLYEARDNILQIRTLSIDTLGEYICQAYNGIGKPVDWSITVQAYRIDDYDDSPYLISNQNEVLITRKSQTEATTTIAPEIEIPVYTVPVTTRIVSERTQLAAGSELNLLCEVDGYPVPEVYWTKDSAAIKSDDRITATETRLTVSRTNTNDTGVYGCHAFNAYNSHYSSVQISVEGLYIPPTCKDNPYFANCYLIVRSKFCYHKYYSNFCCKSCVEAGQLDVRNLQLHADDTLYRK